MFRYAFLCVCLGLTAYAANGRLAHAAVEVQKVVTMQLAPNQQQFDVILASNPTTGYQWSVVQYDKKLLRLKKKQYLRPKTNRIGAGGQMVFTFALAAQKPKGSTDIRFKYARAWETSGGTVQVTRVLFPK